MVYHNRKSKKKKFCLYPQDTAYCNNTFLYSSEIISNKYDHHISYLFLRSREFKDFIQYNDLIFDYLIFNDLIFMLNVNANSFHDILDT